MKRHDQPLTGFRAVVSTVLAGLLGGPAVLPAPIATAPGRNEGPQQTITRNLRPQQQTARTQAPAPGGSAQALAQLSGFDPFGNLLKGGNGCTPYQWGISSACAKMRRKNALRAKGWSGQRI